MKTTALSLLFCGCAGALPAEPPVVVAITQPIEAVQPVEEDPEAEREAVIAAVLASEQGLIEERNLELHLANWATDARLVRARSSQPGPHDVTLDFEQMSAVERELLLRQLPASHRAEGIAVTLDGDSATLRWRSFIDSEIAIDVFRELYRLEKRDGRWQIVYRRYWPVARTENGVTAEFDEAWFRERDQAIEEIRGADPRELLSELFSAYRFAEALELSRVLSLREDADTWVWEMRAMSALMMGDAKEGAFAYASAEALRNP